MGETLHGWNDFFLAEAGAAAALTGLLFVAVSINLTKILEFKNLPARVAEALIALLSVLVVATFGLVPGQALWGYGAEIGGTGLAVWACQLTALLRAHKEDKLPARQAGRVVGRILLNQAPPLFLMIAGGLMLSGCEQGAYWLVPATLSAFAAGMFGAWVLLIEIQR